VRAMRAALDTRAPGEAPDLATVQTRLGEVSKGARAETAGEPPSAVGHQGTGRRRRGRARS